MTSSRYRLDWAAVACMAGLLLLTTFAARAGNGWKNMRETIPMNGLATDGSVYVAVSQTGIWTSDDLKNWSRATLPAGAHAGFYDVIYGNGRFVAVGPAAGGIVASPDGFNWSIAFDGGSDRNLVFNSIAFDGNGTFVAVGQDATGSVAAVSSDGGDSWQLEKVDADAAANVTNHLDNIAWGDGRFVALGSITTDDGSNGKTVQDVLYTSVDGVTWSSASRAPDDVELRNDLAFGMVNGAPLFVAAMYNGVATSADTINWNLIGLSGPDVYENPTFNRTAFLNGRFIGAATIFCLDPDTCENTSAIYESADGSTWTKYTLQPAGASVLGLDALAPAGASEFVAAGYNGVYESSAGGTVWTKLFTGPQTNLETCVVYATVNGRSEFVAPGIGAVSTSTDGSNWSAVASNSGGILSGNGCAAAKAGRIVVINNINMLLWSDDAVHWKNPLSSTTAGFRGVAVLGNKFYATRVNAGALEVYSSDSGDAWTELTVSGLPGGVQLPGFAGAYHASLTGGGGRLVTWGTTSSGDFVAASSDGSTWSIANGIPTGATVQGVAYGQDSYMLIGVDKNNNTVLLSSNDGVHWQPVSGAPAGLQVGWEAFVYATGRWYALGQDATGQFVGLESGDGKNWLVTKSGFGNSATLDAASLASNGQTIVAATQYDMFQITPQSAPGPSSGGSNPPGGTSGGGLQNSGGGGAVGLAGLLMLGLLSWLSACRFRARSST